MKRIIDRLAAAGRASGSSALLLAMLAAAPIASQAQTITLFGALSNFDVLNDTGQDAHGFEIEIDGITSAQAPYYFTATRYGGPSIIPIQNGVIFHYASQWDAVKQQFTTTTVTPASFTPTFGHSCVFTNIVGCDHYGVGVIGATPTNVTYRWLVADPNSPGALIPFAGPAVSIPQPTVTVVPPQQIGAAPVVVFQIKVPPPPPPPIPKPVPQYGDAQWVKVYKTELQREVGLDELVDDNPAVPQDPGLLETGWKLLQFNPNSNGKSGILTNQGGLGSGSHSVLRRYEHYKFTGAYSDVDHSAICADGICAAPAPNEVGDFIGAQNAAANVGVPSITVTRIGNGSVTGASGKINCGASCTTTTTAGALVTLTARAPSNGVFNGWSGACNGTDPNCTVTVNDQVNVTATFTTIYNLSISHSNAGTVTGNPAGVSAQIDCGSTCSTKFLAGTIVTLTASPVAGHTFLGWGGACAGTALSCDVNISKDTSVTANFK